MKGSARFHDDGQLAVHGATQRLSHGQPRCFNPGQFIDVALKVLLGGRLQLRLQVTEK